MSERTFDQDWVVAPGETIRECMETKGWSIEQFARELKVGVGVVESLLRGRWYIDLSMAMKLKRTLGHSARFWLVREAQYRGGLLDGLNDVTPRFTDRFPRLAEELEEMNQERPEALDSTTPPKGPDNE